MDQHELREACAEFITPITCLENLELVSYDGEVLVGKATVTESSLNAYGHAHGGWLFTLCDMMSGIYVRLQKRAAVTLSSNVNFLKGANPGDEVRISVSTLHSGRTTVVEQVDLAKEDGTLLLQGTFTMFVIGSLD